MIQFQNAEFKRAAVSARDFIHDDLPKIAFSGRSNVGKSSVINRLANRKNLAYVGATPGKTQQINYFLVDRKLWLVDLPGYGYAKVSQKERDRWGSLMEAFFAEPDQISAGVQIVDIRHKPTADDCTMHQWFVDSGCREIIVANKSDKLKPSQLQPCIDVIYKTLKLGENSLFLPFSAEKGTGREDLIGLISDLL